MDKNIKIKRQEALDYHKQDKPGKLEIQATKTLNSQRDLSLAYSPGVAIPCEEIHEKPTLAYEYTSKGNLVAVITNGTAVLGLGNIGALASKPVMEGKSVLFKKFADIDSIDLEIDSIDVDKFDYLMRDTKNIGLEYSLDCSRLIMQARVIDNEICYPEKLSFTIYKRSL